MKKSLSSLFLLLFVTIAICNASDNENKKLDLMGAYSKIWYTHSAINYPHSKEKLNNCIKNNDATCLSCYKEVKAAKQYLLDQIATHPDKVLTFTLDTIFNYCQKEPAETFEAIIQDESLCFGAVIAIYFFDQEKHDLIMLDRIKDAPPKVLDKVFGNFEWLYNRPSPQRWIKFIEKLPEKVMTKGGKSFFIDRLKMKKGDYEEFGLML